MLAPERFLRIAEEAGLMVPITRWIILLAFRTAGDWLRRLPGNQPFFISINISATGLRDAGLRNQEPFAAHETSATAEVHTLEDDDSPTLLLPAAAVQFPKEEEIS